MRRADRAGSGGYSGQFWALYFLQQVSKVDALTSAYIVGAALLIATPSLIFFGWLSDQIGRKPVITRREERQEVILGSYVRGNL